MFSHLYDEKFERKHPNLILYNPSNEYSASVNLPQLFLCVPVENTKCVFSDSILGTYSFYTPIRLELDGNTVSTKTIILFM